MGHAAEQQSQRTHIAGIPSVSVMEIWRSVEPILSRVVTKETGETLGSVLTALQTAKKQLWIVGTFQGAVITEIQDRPSERVLFVVFIAGDDMKSWMDDLAALLDEYAQANDCAAIEFNGRRGWNKIGESRPEWRAIRTVFRREFRS